ncbi:MAG: hypothetical protein KDD70_14690, partial [Bdellovibrionales bacterium]|nr:hypothetical protein [Bdellovibrionales bacterium]
MYLRHRHLVTGLILGFLSLASYSLEASIATNFPLSVSHFFVLFAALAAGPEAALIAFSVGSFPSTFFDEGNFRYIFQGAVLTATVLASRKWLEEIPPYFSVLLVWLLVLIPSHIFFPWVHWHRSVHTHFLGLQALVDIFLVAFASMCTYIPWVYENILGKPYQPNQQRL